MKQLNIIFALMALYCFPALAGKPAKKEILFNTGSGMVVYNEYVPLKDKPINIYYYIPEGGNIKTMPILIVLHGAARDPEEFLNALKEKAKEKKVMVFAPGFSKEFYSNSDYQEVGIFTNENALKSEGEQTISVIDPIFRFIVTHSVSGAKKYDIYGHSAGGQFVHRFMLFHYSPYVNRAMVGSPGWYTFPDTKSPYPYGLKNTNSENEKTIQKFLSKHVILQLGLKDTIRESYLRVTPEAEAQGANRYARGINFFNYLQEKAETNHWKFNWTKVVVPDVPHNSGLMGQFGIEYLYK